MTSRKIRPIRVGMDVPSAEKYYPTFSLRLTDFPAAKDWKVGEEYEIEMTVKLRGKIEDVKYGGNYSFEIREIATDEDDD